MVGDGWWVLGDGGLGVDDDASKVGDGWWVLGDGGLGVDDDASKVGDGWWEDCFVRLSAAMRSVALESWLS